MSRIAVVAVIMAGSLTSGWLCGRAIGQEDTRQPSANRTATLKRFVAELVEITPGKGTFPESVTTPAGKLSPKAPFRISQYETTQELYQVVMGRNPSRWKGPRNSVEGVTRLEADEFCERLSQLLRQQNLIGDSENVRLPTPTEWEYSCRGGSEKPYCFGDLSGEQLDAHAWHTGNAAGNDPAVGVLQPNAFGLFDFHGYLWEFVDDVDGSTDRSRAVAWAMGGSWRDAAPLLSSDSKIPVPEYASSDAIGFRCVVSGPPSPGKIPASR